MLIQFDRRRISILAIGIVIVVLLLGFYHSPEYVPAEISKVKTSVSTWLKGSEPSLGDETYKDHFNLPASSEPSESSHASSDTKETESSGEMRILPIGLEDQPDVLPPDSASASPYTSTALPAAADFINVLPPTLPLSTSVSLSATASSSATTEAPVWADLPPATTSTMEYTRPNNTESERPVWADAQESTMVTSTVSATGSAAASASKTGEMWYLDES